MRSVIRMSNIAFATLLLSLLVFASQIVQAAPTVINTADAGAGSLRDAILAATAGSTIDFAIPTSDPGYNLVTDRFTINLVTPLPDISVVLTIDNTMISGVTVNGGSSFRIFTLANTTVVIIRRLTISNGNSNGVGDLAKGGGIFMGNSSTLTLNNCIVSGNTATNGGGGIWMNDSSTLHMVDSTISNNTTTGGDGGGIRINTSGTLNITSSTVSGNHADAPAGGGGGIYNGVSGTVNATNSTVSGNTAGNLGGGISNNASVTISSSTIASNTATNGGGGIFNGPTFTATLSNCLVALNTGAGSPDLQGTFTANFCLIGNADGSTIAGANNQLGTTAVPINPLLGPLQDNGGPTFTRALFGGSPAIDTGSTALPTDQRGVTRPKDGDGVGGAQPDIGSFELDSAPPARTFVSWTGNDANPCTFTSPCRLFQRGHDAVGAGGEVVALTSAGYGTLTITKSVTISGVGVTAVASPYSTESAITIANAGITVTLRSISIRAFGAGTGGSGINVTAVSNLHVEDCVISGFALEGIVVTLTADGSYIFIKDTIVRNNTKDGIKTSTSTGTVRTSIDNCRSEGNGFSGFFALDNSRMTINRSVASGNGNVGFLAGGLTAGATTQLNCEECVSSRNDNGFAVNASSPGTATIRVAHSTATNNSTAGFIVFGTGVFNTLGNNTVRGNGTETTGVITPIGLQ